MLVPPGLTRLLPMSDTGYLSRPDRQDMDIADKTAGVHVSHLNVGEVEADGRLVEDVDAALVGHVGGQLEPLPLAAGQRGERLADASARGASGP